VGPFRAQRHSYGQGAAVTLQALTQTTGAARGILGKASWTMTAPPESHADAVTDYPDEQSAALGLLGEVTSLLVNQIVDFVVIGPSYSTAARFHTQVHSTWTSC